MNLGRNPSWCKNYEKSRGCSWEICRDCERWNPIERIALKEKLAAAAAEIEVRKATEAFLREVLQRSLSDWAKANEIIEAIPFHPFTLVVKEI